MSNCVLTDFKSGNTGINFFENIVTILGKIYLLCIELASLFWYIYVPRISSRVLCFQKLATPAPIFFLITENTANILG